jgi:hypothetical protein
METISCWIEIVPSITHSREVLLNDSEPYCQMEYSGCRVYCFLEYKKVTQRLWLNLSESLLSFSAPFDQTKKISIQQIVVQSAKLDLSPVPT